MNTKGKRSGVAGNAQTCPDHGAKFPLLQCSSPRPIQAEMRRKSMDNEAALARHSVGHPTSIFNCWPRIAHTRNESGPSTNTCDMQ